MFVILFLADERVVHLDLVKDVLDPEPNLSRILFPVFGGQRIPLRRHLLVTRVLVWQIYVADARQISTFFQVRAPDRDFDLVGRVVDEAVGKARRYKLKTWIQTGS